MDKPGKVTLADVEKALQDLGGEATWTDWLGQLTKNRNGDTSHYIDDLNYEKTAFQVVQQHCPGYAKYTGTTRFEQVGDHRFRLAEGSSAVTNRDILGRLCPVVERLAEDVRLLQEEIKRLQSACG